MTDVLAELRSPEGLADPFPIYDRLRENDPVHRTSTGVYLLTRYADGERVLKEWEHFHGPDPERWREEYPSVDDHESLQELVYSNMLALRPPQHTRLRTHLGRGLTPQRVRAMHDTIQRVCGEAIAELRDRLGDGGVANLHAVLSNPVPMRVSASLVGVPESDHGWYAKVLPDVLRCSDPAATEEDLRVSDRAVVETREYLIDMIAARRRNPGDDLLSGLIESGGDITEEELLMVALGLLRGGFETTAAGIDNGVLILLNNPELVSLLRDDPGRAQAFTIEVLRHSSPVQCNPGVRLAARDVEIGGVTIPQNSEVRVLIGAANRDPDVFTAPEEFRIDRDGPPPLTFGTGIHFCPASSLARFELAIVFARLVAELPGLAFAGTPMRRPTMVLRTFDEFPVTLR
jgi:cytochrome P450 family 114